MQEENYINELIDRQYSVYGLLPVAVGTVLEFVRTNTIVHFINP